MVYLLTIILAEFSPFMDNELFLINWAGPIPVGKVRQLTINNDLFFSEQQKKTIHFFTYGLYSLEIHFFKLDFLNPSNLF